MKNVKNILSTLAFVFAIGAAFAFVPLKAEDSTKAIHGKVSSCPNGTVSNQCLTSNNGDFCTFDFGAPIGVQQVVDPTQTTGCQNLQSLRLPSNP